MPSESDLSPTIDATLPLADSEAGEVTSPPGYEFLGELGRGGMSVVWRARDLRLAREVALKYLLVGQPDRVRTEAEALARLQHPHIVQVFEIGEHRGQPYLALELCPDGSLEDRLVHGPIPPRDAAELVRTLAGATQAAHDARILHRDLKPANVLLAGATPKIADFGLARQLDDVSRTASGAILGTPSYMAPEQALGQSDLGPACDVYALGAILYACLTGRPPFRAATTMETLWQVLHSDPVSPRQLNPGVPADLETIALKCLGKERGKRYVRAQDLADDLGRFLEGRPITARPVGWIERGWRWVKRNPVVAGLASLVVLVLVAGALVAGLYAIQASLEAKRANRETENASQAAIAAGVARKEAEAQLVRARLSRYSQLLDLAHRNAEPDWLGMTDWDLRGPEYRYLTALFHHLGRRALPALPGRIHHAAWSPDGQRIVLGCETGAAHILDVSSGRELLQLKIGVPVYWAEFSPDGRTIVTGSEDRKVRLWNLTTGRETRFWWLNQPAKVAVWSPDGRLVAGVDEQGVRVWNVGTGVEVYQVAAGDLQMRWAAWSPNGKQLALSGGMGVRLVDAVTGKPIPGWEDNHAFAPESTRNSDLAWNIDGSVLAVGYGSHGCRFFDSTNGRRLHWSLPGECHAVAWAPDGMRLALCLKGSIGVFHWNDEVRVHTLPLANNPGDSTPLTWSPNGRTLLTIEKNKPVLWDTMAGVGFVDQVPNRGGISRVAWSPDGSLLACPMFGNGMDIRSFDGRETRSLGTFAEELPACDAAFHPRGTHLALTLGGEKPGLLIRDLRTGAERQLGVKDPRALTWSPDGTRIATAGGDGAVRIFDIVGDIEERRLDGHREKVHTVAWSPDGRWVASGGDDRIVRVWEAETGKVVAELKGHVGQVQHLAWSPTDGRLASGSFDGTARIWDVTSKREVLTLRTLDPPTTSVDWSRDGRILLTAGHLNLHLWETTTGQQLVRLACEHRRHRANIWTAAFHPSGEWIVYGDGEGQLRLWSWDSPLLERSRPLTGTTWELVSVAFWREGQRLVAQDTNGAIVVWDMRTGQQVPQEDEPDELPKQQEAIDSTTGIRAVIEGSDLRVYFPTPTGNRKPPRDLFARISPGLWHHLQARHWLTSEPHVAAFHLEQRLECDPFDGTAKEELEKVLKGLPDSPPYRALRQRWRTFQTACVAGLIGNLTAGSFAGLLHEP